MKVPVLSVWQPWASLLVSGIKNIENREWKLPEKFLNQKIYIHASKKKDWFEFEIANQKFQSFMNNKESLQPSNSDSWKFGGIIGWVIFDKIVTESESIWYFGTYGFHVKEFGEIPFLECRGHQKIFYVDLKEQKDA